jgi:zinc protease
MLIADAYALEVDRKVLDNGLKLMVVERHNLPLVKVTIGIGSGSVIEPEEKAGLANLTASLLKSGTKSRTAEEIDEAIDFVGGSIGASGGTDYSTVTLSILKKDIDLGFELLSDVIMNPLFPEEELVKKVKRIKGGLKQSEDNPGFVASKAFKKEVFGSHPYGRLTRGSEETLDAIEREDVVNFHSSYYLPNNSVMSVVGDITADEVSALINRYFSKWASKKFERPLLAEPDEKRERKTVIVDKELTQANIILGHIGISREHPDYYKVSVMDYILGRGGFASRLMLNIREEKGLAYSIYSVFSADKESGSFRVSLQTKNESANTAIEEIIKEMKRISTEPVTDMELSDAKSFLTGSFPMRVESSSRIASFLVAVEYYGLGVDYIDNYPSYINSITKEDVLYAAQKYLDPENFVLVVVADEKEAAIKKDYSH